jgi:hypothetical protein
MKTPVKTIFKHLAAAFATTALAQGAAHAGAVFTFDTSAIAGSTTAFSFDADEMTFTAVGLPTVTITDTNNDGVIGNADDFVEVGFQSIVNFQLGNVNVPGTGLNSSYELIVPFTFTGVSDIVGGNNVATFTSGSATIFYDEVLDSSSAGGTAIATMSLPGANGSQCVITGPGLAEGSCGVLMDFVASAGGIWTVGGVDLATLLASIEINVDVDDINPPFSVAYPGFGVTCGGAMALCTQTVNLDQDGSAVLNTVPEPASIALAGLGLLGLGVSRRRKAA